jgi:solute carrier family 25 protein 38
VAKVAMQVAPIEKPSNAAMSRGQFNL